MPANADPGQASEGVNAPVGSLLPSLLVGLALASSLALVGAVGLEDSRQKAGNAQVRTLTHGFQALFLTSMIEDPSPLYPATALRAWLGAMRHIQGHRFPGLDFCQRPQGMPIELPVEAESTASNGALLGDVVHRQLCPLQLLDWGAISYRQTQGGKGYLVGGTMAVGGEARLYLLGGERGF